MRLRWMALLFGVAAVAPPGRGAVSVGDEAPEIEVSEWINSRPTEWKKLRGRAVLVEFWRTT